MAGELLFRLFDVDRYHELLPFLDELASTRKLGDAAAAKVRLALARPDGGGGRHANEVETLERIVTNRELDPRVFISPASLNRAITALVEILCFEERGTWSLVERMGASWVVLESSLGVLYDQRWFGDYACGQPSGSVELAYPREETTSFMLTRAALDEVLAALRTASHKPDLDQRDRAEVDGLITLVLRAQSVKRWSLVYSTLL